MTETTEIPENLPTEKRLALHLLCLISDRQNDAVWTAQHLTAPEVATTALAAVAQFKVGKATADDLIGALLAVTAWIVQHHPNDDVSIPMLSGPQHPH
ncbi:MAG: hypothetical protein H6975_05185 [Gammaproteobacteria bacterium]|nr:hypothetical protein [Gammaproteobacteria bacterium]